MQRHLADVVFWGKFDEATGASLPLAAHCIDVALVFRALVDLPGIRRALETSAGTTLASAQLDRLAVLAAFHDAGKANLGFQARILPRTRERAGHVRELLVFFQDEGLGELFAASVEYETLATWADSSTLGNFFLASWSHHGYPQRPDSLGGAEVLRFKRYWAPASGIDPFDGIREIGNWCRRAFPAAWERGGPALPSSARLQHRFAGLVMLADWIGSDTRVFPVRPCAPAERIRADRSLISPLLHRIGLDASVYASWTANRVPTSFAERFGFAPRPLQVLVGELDPADDAARLLVLEAETGSGKTEAAIHWFLALFGSGLVDGLYFALPTRVAARDLYERVRRIVERLFPDPSARPPVLLAVPGYVQVDGRAVDSTLPEAADREPWATDGAQGDRRAIRLWAAERPKRFLAATVAVGTVDQALLSMVQARHAHLRSVCLDRSLLVVDEVHASDRYARRLLEDLLHHHVGSGGYALLLSATLGTEARLSVVSHATGADRLPPSDLRGAVEIPYPALSTAARTLPCAPSASRRVVRIELEPHARAPATVISRIHRALTEGARVLVVLNTVDRAIEFFREAEAVIEGAFLFSPAGRPCPHHGRFAPSDRVLLDRHVARTLGKDSPGGPVLLVGTQTLEQSLDIDADLLVTDLCPADVLLQRLGRLHRHDRPRPPEFSVPRCIVLVPEIPSLEDALGDDGTIRRPWNSVGYGSVYEDARILELTWRYLRSNPELVLPHQNRDFVEATIHSESLATLRGSRWKRHANLVEGSLIAGTVAASAVSLAPLLELPFDSLPFNDIGQKVATRLGAPTWQLPLPSPTPGPFHEVVNEVLVPARFLPSEPVAVAATRPLDGGGFLLEVDAVDGRSARFSYTRYGLRPARGDPR